MLNIIVQPNLLGVLRPYKELFEMRTYRTIDCILLGDEILKLGTRLYVLCNGNLKRRFFKEVYYFLSY